MIKYLYYIDILVIVMKAKLYKSDSYVNAELGYTLRMNYSYTENFELHYHDYYEFFLTISGKAIQIINGKRQILPEHSLVLVRSGDEHTYIKEGKFSFVNLTFTDDTMRKLCDYFGEDLKNILKKDMPPSVVLKNDDFAKVMAELNSLNTIKVNDKQKLTLKMKLILTQIIAYFMESEQDKTKTVVPEWLSTLVCQAKKAENINMTLSDMSVVSGKSREHISRSFKKYYSVTVAEFMNEQKLNYSANLLLNTNLQIIDVCYECGFQNLSWFYRKFKEKFSVTPVQFRNNLR